MTSAERLRELGRKIASEQDSWLRQDDQRPPTSEALLARLAKVRPGPSRLTLAALLSAAVVLVAAFVLGLSGGLRAAPLAVSVRGVELSDPTAGWWSVEREQSVPLSFSDGSLVTLAAGTRARVTRVSAVGAELIVEAGRAEVHVSPRANAHWKFNLGPYVVDVLGTQFHVAWQPESDTFELTLYKGRVQVSGCIFGEGRPVVAGETVRAFCKAKRVETTLGKPLTPASLDKPEASAKLGAVEGSEPSRVNPVGFASRSHRGGLPPLGSEAATASPPALGGVAAQAPAPATVAAPAQAWQELAATHDYAGALRRVEQMGFESESARLDAKSLVLLADVARYAGSTARSLYAYKLVRQRFANSREAALAAYFLARHAFDKQADYSEAARWFRAYLNEHPGGGLAREALGRLMEAQDHLGQASEASASARQYLAEYPFGPGAKLARQLASR